MLALKLFFIFLFQSFFVCLIIMQLQIAICPVLHSTTMALLCRNGENLNTTDIYCPISGTYSPRMGAAGLEISDIAVHKE